MQLDGFVQNGVIVHSGGCSLPEGTLVTVSCLDTGEQPRSENKRVELPLVRTGTPGTLDLTNERIAAILTTKTLRRCEACGICLPDVNV
jgi:hypothetical protein